MSTGQQSTRNTGYGEPVFEFTDRDFNDLRELAYKLTGISLADHKRDLVYGRLTRRLRAYGLTRFRDYCDILKENSPDEVEQFTNAITTNLTSFFRESHHFDYLKNTVAPELVRHHRKNGRIRIWSAGCSTGEEAYSIAMTLRDAIPSIDDLNLRILATDLDSNVVRHGATGVYVDSRVDGLDKSLVKRWFTRGSGSHAGKVKVHDDLRKMVAFKQLNLMKPWPMKGMFDVIFCRNVVIYFDKDTQRVLFDRFAELLPNGSSLFIGHSETLHNVTERFELDGRTIYRKVS